jgi:hypothetical protein
MTLKPPTYNVVGTTHLPFNVSPPCFGPSRPIMEFNTIEAEASNVYIHDHDSRVYINIEFKLKNQYLFNSM